MNGMKCVIGNPARKNPKGITVYTAKWCGACKTRVPQIIKKAKAAGLEVKTIDWDEDLTEIQREKLQRRVQFVPYIEYMGKEINEEEIELINQPHKIKEV